MKLSRKLSLGLFAIILLLIAGQIYISKDIVDDLNSLREGSSRENLPERKTYKYLELSPFDTIVVESQKIRIEKGEKCEVFYNSLLHSKPQIEGEKLTIKRKNNYINNEEIFVFVPDLQLLEVINDQYGGITMSGFSGEKAKINIRNSIYRTLLFTDLSEIDLSVESAYLELCTFKGTNKIDASLSNAYLQMTSIHDSIQEINLQLNHGGFNIAQDIPDLIQNIRINGSLGYRGGSGSWISLNDEGPEYYMEESSIKGDIFICDTLQIDVVNSKEENARFHLSLPKEIKAQSVSIKRADEISFSGGKIVE